VSSAGVEYGKSIAMWENVVFNDRQVSPLKKKIYGTGECNIKWGRDKKKAIEYQMGLADLKAGVPKRGERLIIQQKMRNGRDENK
jgi:hypothetical protein